MNYWISAEKELPSHYGDILLLINKRIIRVGHYNRGLNEWFYCSNGNFDDSDKIKDGHKVTHWRELPTIDIE